MNEMDAWIYLDGPEPAIVREMLDAIRRPLSQVARAEPDGEALSRRVMSEIAARRSLRASSRAPEPPASPANDEAPPTALAPTAPPLVEGPTVRAPTLDPRAADTGPRRPQVTVIAPAAPAASAPKSGGALELAQTGDIPAELRAPRPVTPFIHPSKAPKRAAKTLQAEVSKLNVGQTAPLENDIHAIAMRVLPFTPSAGAGEGAGRAPSQAPEEAREGGLSLREYASLLAELGMDRWERGYVLARYRVAGEAALQALAAQWRARMAREPWVEGAIEEARRRYTEYLLSQWGR